ncbi:MAG: hypothetical protein IKL06_03320 [Lachnospiraceae bacterium]|nr:hypothetical protein [Lachnospiraceae bacterium]
MKKSKKWLIVLFVFVVLCFIIWKKDRMQKEVILDGVLINQFLKTEVTEQIEADMLAALGGDSEKEEVYLDAAMSIDLEAQDPDTVTNLGKITTYVFGKELDFMIVEPEIAEHYANLNGLADLQEVLSEELTEELAERDLLYESESGKACGIQLAESTFVKEYGIEIENPVFCMVNNSEKKEKVEQIISWIVSR